MKFRKKPVVIEAFQWKGNVGNLMTWMAENHLSGIYEIGDNCLLIPTLEGQMICSYGDWIIKGIKGEVYPCKPDVFEKTYEGVVNEQCLDLHNNMWEYEMQ